MIRTLAGKIFLAFCLVLLVVLGLGLWSLGATRRLHTLNRALLERAIPALRLQVELQDQVATLVRHETRAVVLRDADFLGLHRQGIQGFRAALSTLEALLDGPAPRAALDRVRTRFGEYVAATEAQWARLAAGNLQEVRRLSEGPTREAVDRLRAALDELLTASRTELERQVAEAGTLEGVARVATGLSLVASLAVGLGLATMVALRIARPIRELSRATEAVARGEYEVPVVVASRDEVGTLARNFQEMARRLRELDELKEEFFSNISHDFRSPLTSIRMAARLVATEPVGPRQRRWLDIIQQDAEKLLRLTNQILDLARLRSHLLQLELQPTNLRDVVELAASELRPVAAAKGVELRVEVPEPAPAVVCDPGRIQQVLTNLLANGVKFTPPGGRVALTVEDRGPEVQVTVSDTGPGIPADALPRIFERFHQAHRDKGGTGLGLAIVKGFVEAHGGRVWADSREGEGARFAVLLPREPSPTG